MLHTHFLIVSYLGQVEGSNSVLSDEYLPRLAGENQPPVEEAEEVDENGEEHEYVMVPQMIKSKITPAVVEAFLNDSFAALEVADEGGGMPDSPDKKPLVLVCGPPRMIELLAGRRGHRGAAEASSGQLARGVLGELGYTGG